MPGPLHGLRVLDLSSVVLGPMAAQILGDMDADVVKVEPPEGDTTRQLGPKRNPGLGSLYLPCNRNKRSVVLDLTQPAGRDALLRLASGAAALLHNLRPQAAARLGLEYEAVRAVNPRLVYCNIPAMTVNTLETLLDDPQLAATGFWKLVEHPTEGTLRMPDVPTTFGATPGGIRRLPPRLGEHRVEVLREAGFSAAEIDALVAQGVSRSV